MTPEQCAWKMIRQHPKAETVRFNIGYIEYVYRVVRGKPVLEYKGSVYAEGREFPSCD